MYRRSERLAGSLYTGLQLSEPRRHRAAAWGESERPAAGQVRELAVDRTTSVILLDGHCDIAVAPRLSRTVGAALGAGRVRLVVDLCGTTFVEVTILTALLHAHRRVAELDGRVAIACDRQDLLDALAASGLDDVFEVYDNRDAALAAFGSIAAV
jgi:anti-anti-sigma factor